MSVEPVKRRYDATRRRAGAEASRDRTCAAAEALFLRDGYARTSIAAVARAAGVSPASVYLAFETKAALLDATILRAVRAQEGASVADLVAGDPDTLLARTAAAHDTTMRRAAPILALGEAAVFMDAALRPMRARAHARLRASWAEIAQLLAGAGLLRAGLSVADATDVLFTTTSETAYLRFVEARPAAAYAPWLEATLTAALTAGTARG